MTAPTLAHSTDFGRMYSRRRGGVPEVPSITTVIGALHQEMGWWEAKCAVDAAFPYLERLVAVRDSGDWRKERAAKDWLRDAATRDRDDAAARGDFVHNYAEQFALRTIGRATDADVEYHLDLCRGAGVESYLPAFHDFWEAFSPRVIGAEATLWNAEVGYAGTTDLLCEIDTPSGPVRAVLDWKTKRTLYKRNGERKEKDLQPYTGMQLAAAAMASEVWVPDDADTSQDRWEPFTFAPEVGLAVGIAPDGYVVRQYDIYAPLVWESFVALRQAWAFLSEGALTMSPALSGAGDIRRGTPRP